MMGYVLDGSVMSLFAVSCVDIVVFIVFEGVDFDVEILMDAK